MTMSALKVSRLFSTLMIWGKSIRSRRGGEGEEGGTTQPWRVEEDRIGQQHLLTKKDRQQQSTYSYILQYN